MSLLQYGCTKATSQLNDKIGILNAQVDDNYADYLLGVTTDEMAMMDTQNKKLDIKLINERLKGELLYFQIKVSTFESIRGIMGRNHVIACLPLDPDVILSPMEASAETSSQASDLANTSSTPLSVLSLPTAPTKPHMPIAAAKEIAQDPTKSSGKEPWLLNLKNNLNTLNRTAVLGYSFDIFCIYLLLSISSNPYYYISSQI
ncbi:hypothetical protein ACH5RR_012109 [Cinchona calisaya]|uniref:Uncharacterized protein n=1 Tax=Cinchona calisaya TaxID=153742 RepID=A0ABD3A8E3_9GENT